VNDTKSPTGCWYFGLPKQNEAWDSHAGDLILNQPKYATKKAPREIVQATVENQLMCRVNDVFSSHARTALQPASYRREVLAKVDSDQELNGRMFASRPRPQIFYTEGTFQVIGKVIDNSGKRKNLHDTLLPSLAWPSDHPLLMVTFRYRKNAMLGDLELWSIRLVVVAAFLVAVPCLARVCTKRRSALTQKAAEAIDEQHKTEEAFEAMDLDGDGVVTADEAKRALARASDHEGAEHSQPAAASSR
jgi:hypothetical protein